jgi:hypothetical protein
VSTPGEVAAGPAPADPAVAFVFDGVLTVVDGAVVKLAERDQVGDHGRAAVRPVGDVMGDEWVAARAAGEATALVAEVQRPDQFRGGEAVGATVLGQQFGVAAGEASHDLGRDRGSVLDVADLALELVAVFGGAGECGGVGVQHEAGAGRGAAEHDLREGIGATRGPRGRSLFVGLRVGRRCRVDVRGDSLERVSDELCVSRGDSCWLVSRGSGLRSGF